MMTDTERKIKFLESCWNEESKKYEIQCKCGILHKLNIKMIFVIDMHRLKCTCGEVIIK